MSRKTDLERSIRDSYDIIREYEDIIRFSDRPEEKARARRAIREQWSNIESYLAEYRRLTDDALPADIAEIAAHFAEYADQSHVVSGDAEAGHESVVFLRRQLAEVEANLRLIQERKAQYVLQVDVPLQLIKEERRLMARIGELKRRLAEEEGRQ